VDPAARGFPGGCHCGNLRLDYASARPAAETEVRACGCSFCRKHGARSISDPQGRVRIRVDEPEALLRYRFGLHTAEFLVCRRCGVYVGAVARIGDADYAVVNANVLDAAQEFRRAPVAASYEGESADERRERRRRRWTPVAGPGA